MKEIQSLYTRLEDKNSKAQTRDLRSERSAEISTHDAPDSHVNTGIASPNAVYVKSPSQQNPVHNGNDDDNSEIVPLIMRRSSSASTTADSENSGEESSFIAPLSSRNPTPNHVNTSAVLSETHTQKTSQGGFVWDTQLQTQDSFHLGHDEEQVGGGEEDCSRKCQLCQTLTKTSVTSRLL